MRADWIASSIIALADISVQNVYCANKDRA